MDIAKVTAGILALCLTTSAVMAEHYVGEFTVTAYCSCPKCCGKAAKGLTASGKHVQSGMIAADWGVLPKGTHVRLSVFPGSTLVVEDTGSAIVGNRIDVWFPSHSLAREFGVKHHVKVWVADDSDGAVSRPVGGHWTEPGALAIARR